MDDLSIEAKTDRETIHNIAYAGVGWAEAKKLNKRFRKPLKELRSQVEELFGEDHQDIGEKFFLSVCDQVICSQVFGTDLNRKFYRKFKDVAEPKEAEAADFLTRQPWRNTVYEVIELKDAGFVTIRDLDDGEEKLLYSPPTIERYKAGDRLFGSLLCLYGRSYYTCCIVFGFHCYYPEDLHFIARRLDEARYTQQGLSEVFTAYPVEFVSLFIYDSSSGPFLGRTESEDIDDDVRFCQSEIQIEAPPSPDVLPEQVTIEQKDKYWCLTFEQGLPYEKPVVLGNTKSKKAWLRGFTRGDYNYGQGKLNGIIGFPETPEETASYVMLSAYRDLVRREHSADRIEKLFFPELSEELYYKAFPAGEAEPKDRFGLDADLINRILYKGVDGVPDFVELDFNRPIGPDTAEIPPGYAKARTLLLLIGREGEVQTTQNGYLPLKLVTPLVPFPVKSEEKAPDVFRARVVLSLAGLIEEKDGKIRVTEKGFRILGNKLEEPKLEEPKLYTDREAETGEQQARGTLDPELFELLFRTDLESITWNMFDNYDLCPLVQDAALYLLYQFRRLGKETGKAGVHASVMAQFFLRAFPGVERQVGSKSEDECISKLTNIIQYRFFISFCYFWSLADPVVLPGEERKEPMHWIPTPNFEKLYQWKR